MTVSSLEAAKYLCEISGWKLSSLKLQKILHLSDMNYAGQGRGRLVSENFGRVSKVVEILWRCSPSGMNCARSGGEVKGHRQGRLRGRFPAIDFSHPDLSGGQGRPQQHRHCSRAGHVSP